MYVSFPMDATVELNCCDERNKAIRKSNSKKKCVITGLGVTVVLATVILVSIDLGRQVWNNEEPCFIFQARISFSSLSVPTSTVSELLLEAGMVEANRSSTPVVYLQMEPTGKTCAGVIIDNRTVLTAAHRLDPGVTASVNILSGKKVGNH